MTETCYAKGQKVILVTSQIKNGKWLCKFSIPGFSHLDGGLHGQRFVERLQDGMGSENQRVSARQVAAGGATGLTKGHLLSGSIRRLQKPFYCNDGVAVPVWSVWFIWLVWFN